MTFSQVLAAVVALILPAIGDAADVPCPAELEAVRSYIVEQVDDGRAAGASVVVRMDGEAVWAEGFGLADIERGLKADSNTVYLLASVSKPITATGLMRLVDQNRIDIEKPANDYLPVTKIRTFAGNAEDITVRRLLNHTSGLPTHYSFFYDAVSPPPMDETIRRFAYATYSPGSRYNYSNLGYGILNYITEVVADQPWPKFMEEHVYDPLKMFGTSDHVRPERMDDRAQIYTRDVAGRFVPVGTYDFDHRGASAIWSSAHDLARFCEMHINGGELDGVRVLSEQAARAMTEARPPNMDYGLGWALGERNGHRSFSHSGGMPGVSTLMTAWPDDKLVVVVLTNSDANPLAGGVTRRVEEALLADVALGDALVADDTQPSPATPAPKVPDPPAFAGNWNGHLAHFNGDFPVELTIDDELETHIKFGESQRRKLESVGVREQVFRGSVSGVVLPVQDSYHGHSDLELILEHDGNGNLTGTVFATASTYFGVSFWISLKKVD